MMKNFLFQLDGEAFNLGSLLIKNFCVGARPTVQAAIGKKVDLSVSRYR
jgi:hypothetical protein